MSNETDDLDLLLSLQDRVLETPPTSPSAPARTPQSGYLSDDASPKRGGDVDMSVFRNAVQDCLDYDPETSKKEIKSKNSSDGSVEKFSGLRIRNQLVSPVELANRLSDIRFIRLPAIKKLLLGDTLSGCWATVGVLIEKGEQRMSSAGKPYCIWKVGSLDEDTASVFLFGTAYQKKSKDEVGSVFAFLSCGARKDNSKIGCSLSVYNASQILKLGTSVDYVVCKGNDCKNVINRRQGIYCKYHKLKSSEKYSKSRNELKGGNLRMSVNNHLKSEGIYVVNPHAQKRNVAKPNQVLSVEGLKKALSNAGKVTTNQYSQGIRFLTQITGMGDSKTMKKGPTALNKSLQSAINKPLHSAQKRSSSSAGSELPVKGTSQVPNAKRSKAEERQHSSNKTNQTKEKMIELDFISSDEET
ncbi:zf-primase domain-containing protein [Heracleum sosnowskyi]|uniref:Zf-primase domain-containing protein n=1 Tax=Heracleum sosnowskyi TaxID=360622 RepID=A0AAD8IZG8_9APIA|nr:zf-primase domain-containing protein [Heracleum sosnowskyi]